MSKYTPGPWEVVQDVGFDGLQGWDIEANGKTIVGQEGIQAWRDKAEADARLIAAATDSHEANVSMVDALNVAFHIQPDWDDECIYDELPTSAVAVAYFAARAAIAKATGEKA